jgi:hypothetical protein
MCTVSPPPSLVLAWPWQAPHGWVIFAIVLAIAAVPCSLAVMAVRSQPSALRRRIGWALLLPGALCFIASFFLGFVVVGQADDALLAWVARQDRAVQAQGCTATAWQPLFEHASQTIQETRDLGNNLLVVGFLFLFPMGLICPLRLEAVAARAR